MWLYNVCFGNKGRHQIRVGETESGQHNPHAHLTHDNYEDHDWPYVFSNGIKSTQQHMLTSDANMINGFLIDKLNLDLASYLDLDDNLKFV